MAILFAALSAALFGVGDFFGGLSARKMAAVLTTATAQGVGLVLILVLSLVVGGDPTTADLGFGAAAGLVGGIGLCLFYWAMAHEKMSVIGPISAVNSALVPVIGGLLLGDEPPPLAFVGIALALPAIVLISRETTATEPTDDVPLGGSRGSLPVVAAAISGIGFGLFYVLLSRTGDDAGLWPVVMSRSAAVVVGLTVALALRGPRPNVTGVRLAALAGSIDVIGNALYLISTRHGLLTLVGVIGAMYPASTVVLARFVLHERLARHQVVGLGVAVVAVAIIAAA